MLYTNKLMPIIIFLTLTTHPIQVPLGEGIVEVDVYNMREINLYKQRWDSKPYKVVRIVEKDGLTLERQVNARMVET